VKRKERRDHAHSQNTHPSARRAINGGVIEKMSWGYKRAFMAGRETNLFNRVRARD